MINLLYCLAGDIDEFHARLIRFILNKDFDPFYFSQGGYFFLRYNSENTNTEYARVKNINETSNYLGLPFELKISPFSIRNISFYFKVGTEFSFKLNTKSSIDLKIMPWIYISRI